MIQQIELKKSNAKRKLVKEISTLEGTLKNPFASASFMNFAKEMYCEENLLFWLDAENYRTTERTSTNLKKRGFDMFNKFIAKNADLRISLTKQERVRIHKLIEEGDTKREAFLSVQKNCLSHMANERFPLFLNSPHYQKVLLNMPTAPIQDVDITLTTKHRTEARKERKNYLVTKNKKSTVPKRINNRPKRKSNWGWKNTSIFDSDNSNSDTTSSTRTTITTITTTSVSSTAAASITPSTTTICVTSTISEDLFGLDLHDEAMEDVDRIINSRN